MAQTHPTCFAEKVINSQQIGRSIPKQASTVLTFMATLTSLTGSKRPLPPIAWSPIVEGTWTEPPQDQARSLILRGGTYIDPFRILLNGC